MKNSKKKHTLKRRKYKQLLRAMIIILFCLLIVLGVVIIKHSTPSTNNNSENSAEIKDNSEEVDLTDSFPSEVVQEPEPALNKDMQRAENTATEEHHKTNGLAICMYHYVYDANNPPEVELNNNYIEVHALEEELQYLVENNYYFPTWEEVLQYVNGDLLLPEKSVVLTFDDGDPSFLTLGIPLFEKYKVPATSFLIGNYIADPASLYLSEYVTYQSHSYNMHRGGGSIGHGGIFTALSLEDAVADLNQSIETCGNNDAFAYPFGDYSDSCVEALKTAGFKCAVTTKYGRVYPGDNPLLLPRVRMLKDQSLASFISAVE